MVCRSPCAAWDVRRSFEDKGPNTMAEPNDTAVDNAPLDGPDFGEDLFDNTLEFADNPEPRCPCVLVLDTSQSMAGEPMTALHRGLHVFRDQLLAMPLASKRVEVAIVSFGADVEVVQDFITVDRFQPPALQAAGETPMCTAILKALDILEIRKGRYRANGVPYSRPWVFLITDGMPQGETMETTRQAVQRIRAAEAAHKVAFFAIGIEGANRKLLARIAVRPPLELESLRLGDVFAWLSASTARAATNSADDQLALPSEMGERPA
ncbi:MAG TPA: VWA domain-containing protein [Gemmataceae bacterium]|nr:VWA domain-containing protein [Gemmataceae bacterium]